MDEKFLGPDGMLTKYDNYRYVIVSTAGAAAALIKIIRWTHWTVCFSHASACFACSCHVLYDKRIFKL